MASNNPTVNVQNLAPNRSPLEMILEPKYEIMANPLTPEYQQMKDFVFGAECLWGRQASTVHPRDEPNEWNQLALWGHAIMDRQDGHPDDGARPSTTPYPELFWTVWEQICNHNGFTYKPHRSCLNLTRASKARRSHKHRDHNFPHWNMIIYLTTFHGGHTYIDDEKIPFPADGPEDMIVTFDSEHLHYHEPPEGIDDDRITLVMTYDPLPLDNA
jgi:hypothetical protein